MGELSQRSSSGVQRGRAVRRHGFPARWEVVFAAAGAPCRPRRLRRGYLVETLSRSAGSNFFKSNLAGKRSITLTLRTLARNNSSQSGTRRNCASSLAKDSRLTSQPATCSFAASVSWVQLFRLRNFRTCAPTRFSGAVIGPQRKAVAVKYVLVGEQTLTGNNFAD